MSDGDQDWWRTPVEYGGMQPLSPLRMKELAGGVLGRPALTSAGERDMARAVLWLLDELEQERGHPVPAPRGSISIGPQV
ncbi:hypothetical protein QWJ41_14890 [Nocardioides sp. SOB44]|uniref:Uncharacterized protein n=1 Tax=Nocardioides cremeus TaxID=3058044 RepID=A0ABT8TSS2_9ACTN|nr:hypothetical protein [Nocardioides cremeus]MDO3397011.1 hypothetical protein [Nocardioides cremeus]